MQINLFSAKPTTKQVPTDDAVEFVSAKLKEFTHLKLHKLLYFIQGYHLAYFDKPLFEDDFEAWVHGPVLPTVFRSINRQVQTTMNDTLKFEAKHAKKIVDKFEEKVSADQLGLINNVIKSFGKLDGYHLEELTHSQEPWIKARGTTPPSERSQAKISKTAMKKFFKHEQGW